MTYGEKIAYLRKSNGMTQEDLGKVLNVTYQAVSKWERGESLPDFTTMSQIAKFFQVPLSYFEEDGEIAQAKVQEQNNFVAVNYVGTCTVCGRMLKEDDEYIDYPKIVCKSCLDIERRQKQKEKEVQERRQAYIREKARRDQLGTGVDKKLIVSILVTVALYIILLVSAINDAEYDEYYYGVLMMFVPLAMFGVVQAIANFFNELNYSDGAEGYTRNLSLIVGGAFAILNIVFDIIMYASRGQSGLFFGLIAFGAILSFTFVSQFMWGGIIRSIFTGGGFTFKMPGFIFTLSIDSILWMIITKIFLGIVSILLFIVTTVIFALFAIFASIFTFIPSVIAKTANDINA